MKLNYNDTKIYLPVDHERGVKVNRIMTSCGSLTMNDAAPPHTRKNV